MVEKNIPTSFVTGAAGGGGPGSSQSDSRPNPDPTALTTSQLLREIHGAREVIETRINGMDKAIELLQAATNEIPAHIEASVRRLQELHEEKFSSIQIQFKERDNRLEQTTRDGKTAIDAALQAAEKAVGKTEAAFTKQMDQIGLLLASMTKNIDEKINDLKDRVGTIESRIQDRMGAIDSRIQAVESQKKGAGDLWGVIAGIAGLVVAVIAVILSTASHKFVAP